MTVDPATHTVATATRGVHYLPGEAVAVVTPDSILLVAGGHDDVAGLHEMVSNARDARAVLAAAAGGRVLDLDALPDLALAHRSAAGLRVLLSGRTRCTVVEDGTVTELDGADVALLGEWGISSAATVELSVHDAAGGEPGWPITAGVVPADRVRWVAHSGESRGSSAVGSLSSSSSSTSSPGPAASAPEAGQVRVSDAAGADVTLPPENTAAPASLAPAGPEPVLLAPEPEPAPAPPANDAVPTAGGWDDGEIDDVEYTVGGGINYDRVFNPPPPSAPSPAPAPARTPAPVPTTTSAFAPDPVPEPTPREASHQASASAAPDLGGDTISPDEAAALRDAVSGSGADPADPTDPADPAGEPGPESAGATETAARLCPQNHANPPQLSSCRICGAPLDSPTVRIARPSLGVVRLSTGMFFDLDRPLLLGREPRIDGVDADSAPRLIVLPSPDKAISRSHLRVDIDGWSVHAVDLGSVNGTYLRRGAAEEVRLMPDEPKMLMSGDILVVDDVRIRFEDLP